MAGSIPTVEELKRVGFSERQAKDTRFQHRLAGLIQRRNPSLPPISAMVMAGDLGSLLRARAAVRQGTPPDKAIVLVGSYYRLEFALRYYPLPLLAKELPDLWRGADPDDEDPRFLRMWRACYEWYGGMLTDQPQYPERGPALVKGSYVVYRGETDHRPGPGGIAWSLDYEIAEKFARGAGLRVSHLKGRIWTGRASYRHILGYMVGRGEQEIIVDPLAVRSLTAVDL